MSITHTTNSIPKNYEVYRIGSNWYADYVGYDYRFRVYLGSSESEAISACVEANRWPDE